MTACAEVRVHLLAYQSGRLAAALHDEVRAHLDTCPACAHEEAAEQALTELLERRLPQHPAPIALKRELIRRWPAGRPARRWWRSFVPVAAGGAVVVAALLVLQIPWRAAPDTAAMTAEAVNDHLRVVERRETLPVASPQIHQVKPWFTGRTDFAPVVRFGGDADFPLRGGAVERFLDRQAAVFVYGRRLHTVSLLVFRADGLRWSGQAEPHAARLRGFNVILWRAGDLGYALVSDVDVRDLTELARRLGSG